MGKGYQTLYGGDARAFLDDKGRKSVGVHALKGRICAWAYCVRCGLLDLRNDATRKAMRAPCVVYE